MSPWAAVEIALTQVSNVNRRSGLSFSPCPAWVAGKEDCMAGTGTSGGSKRGFAAMDPAKQREIASLGGKASHGGGRPRGKGR